jgi:Flp pilus assembly protein TadB
MEALFPSTKETSEVWFRGLGFNRRRSKQLWRLYGLEEVRPQGRADDSRPDRGQISQWICSSAHSKAQRAFLFRALPSFALGAAGATAYCGDFSLGALIILGSVVPFVAFVAGRKARATARTNEFLADYPATLMAMASSIKAGLTPLAGLERAVRLLDQKSELRFEVLFLLDSLRRGVGREIAISRFASKIDAPELELFRTAFLLVLENGGRFTPTLERLALVSRERCSLVQSAGVSTQSMRMTGNILITVAPLLVTIVSLGSSDYWKVLTENHAAEVLGITGAMAIVGGYMMLRAMSDFKP